MTRELRRLGVLVRHFLLRFFYNDTLLFESQRRETLLFQVAGFAIFGLLVSHELYKKYFTGLQPDLFGLWLDKLLFLALMMTCTGLISALHWDQLQFDQLDLANLGHLPLSVKSLVMGKFLSLLLLIGTMTLAFNFLATVIFTIYVGVRVDVSIVALGGGYFLTLLLANTGVFLGAAFIMGAIHLLLPGRWRARASGFVQVLLLGFFISVFAWLPRMVPFLPGWRAAGNPWLEFFPPYLFVRFHDRLCGDGHGLPPEGCWLLLASLAGLAGLYVLVLTCGHRRTARVHPPSAGRADRPAARRLGSLLFRLVSHNPIEQAVVSFTLRTLRRGRRQRLRLALVVAFPAAFVASQLLSGYWTSGASYFRQRGFDLVYIPLALHFFLLAGLRLAVRHPIALPANIVFKMAVAGDPRPILSGLHRTIFLFFQLPLAAALGLFYGLAWEWRTGILFSLYNLAIAVLLREILFYSFRSIPFAARFVPEKHRLRYYWPVYLILYMEYLFSFAYAWQSGLHRVRPLAIFIAATLGISRLIRLRARRRLAEEGIVLEEGPQPVMLSLKLDGGLD